MDDKAHINKILVIIMILAILSSLVYAIKNIRSGQCIQDCTHIYNPAFADYKNRTQFPIEGFVANVCVNACKDNTYQGACSEKPGDCCNIFRQDIDTDCHDTDYCASQSDCKNPNYFYCDLKETNPTCKPKLLSGLPCQESYQCIDDSCNIEPSYDYIVVC